MPLETLPAASYDQTDEYPGRMPDDHETTGDELPLDEALRQLPEQLKSRVETAVEQCDFERSPEIENAIKGYYTDHYRTAMVLDQVIDGKQVDPSILANEDTMLESFQLTKSLHDIMAETNRSKQLERVHELIARRLFSEAAVGQTTIGEKEMSLVLGLNDRLLKKAEDEKVFLGNRPNTDESILEKIKSNTDLFWKDSRAAGQLEFHNTPFADEMADANFKIRTKVRQQHEGGDYRSVTADAKNHSVSIHFSESYLSDSYKGVQSGKMVDHVTIGGTVAAPIGEIVKQLPYARGGEYGVISLKPGAEDRSTTIDNANIYAFGGHHEGGTVDDEPSEFGGDRTFYADKHDRAKGENYEIDFGQAMGNNAHIIFLQRDIDIAHRKQANLNGQDIDGRLNYGLGEGRPIVDILEYDYGKETFLEQSAAMEQGKQFVPQHVVDITRSPMGTTDPRLSRVANEHYSYRDGVTPEEQEKELRDAIREMQHQSRERPQYKGKIVAMLRAGTMAYQPSA